MKVMAVMDHIKNPHYNGKEHPGIKDGGIYTVIDTVKGYSIYAKREVIAYSLKEVPGLYETGIFIPLSDFDEKLIHCIKTKPLRKKKLINPYTSKPI